MALRGLGAAVTGGAGFIGSHIVDALLPDNDVIVIDDFSTGKPENLLGPGVGSPVSGTDRWDTGTPRRPRGLKIIRGSITEPKLLRLAFRDTDLVFHLAARPSVPQSIRDPAGTAHVNLTGTLAVLEAARECGVKKVIFSSSCAVYGDARPPVKETALPRPKSPYAVQKLAAEHYCRLYHELYGLRTVCLRYFNVFGPRQDPSSEYAAVIPKFFGDMARRGRVTIYGDGRQTRDFVFVGDAVRANMLAAEGSAADGAVLNVATGEGTSVRALAKEVASVLGRPLRVERAPRREGDIRHSWADISLARKLLDFRPGVPLREGLIISGSALLPRAASR
ncbi:MAG: NAD-dependent epimerase/dehydratase family protein [Thermoplasmatota archaeon]